MTSRRSRTRNGFEPAPGETDRASTLSYAGEIGEQVTVTGTITRKQRVLGSFYSTVSTMLEIDCATSIITIFSTARWADAAGIGEHVTITGTVKKYQCWHGIPETVLGWTKRIDTPTKADQSLGEAPADRPATGWPTGKSRIRRRFPDDQNPAAPPLFPQPSAAGEQP